MATATDERLGELRHRIERLQSKAQESTTGVRSGMRRYLDTLQEDAEAARASARARAAAGEARLEQLDTELRIAEQRLAAEVADDRTEFADAAEAALDSWDAYLERALTTGSSASDETRAEVEAAIAELRRRRLALAESLTEARAGTDEAWRDAQSSALAALDELKHEADAEFRHRGGGTGP